MLRITNISITERAASLLRELQETFRPRVAGDVFAMAFMSSFVEADGTRVKEFRPGYIRHSVSPLERGAMWAVAQPGNGIEFLFMPKFQWRAEQRYVIDLISEKLQLFSIGPAED